jgi:tetratricopeptide (TPR) repeat protein
VGRRDEALQPAVEAADLYRELAKQNPAAYNPNLARALNNLANRLSQVGRRDEALQPAVEAADLYRELAKQNPAAYNPNLARALIVMGLRLADVGRGTQAVDAGGEALELILPMARQHPAVFGGLGKAIARGYLQLCLQAKAEPDHDLFRQASEILSEG